MNVTGDKVWIVLVAIIIVGVMVYVMWNPEKSMYTQSYRLQYTNVWPDFKYEQDIIAKLLKYKKVKFEIVDTNPDIVVDLGMKPMNDAAGIEQMTDNFDKNIKYINYSGENQGPRKHCDFNLTHRFTPKYNNIRIPHWLYRHIAKSQDNGHTTLPQRTSEYNTKFCIMMVSNCHAKYRLNFFEELSKYKRVDSFGSCKRNMEPTLTPPHSFDGKDVICKPYKFMLAMENDNGGKDELASGYVTEKIYEALIQNCVPIYWGDKAVKHDFNKSCFINVSDFPDVQSAIEYIKKVDNDDTLYQSFFNCDILTPYWKENAHLNSSYFKNIFDKIIEKKSPRLSKAVIVEPREHPALAEVIKNIFQKLHIPIILFHGTRNGEFVQKIVDKYSSIPIELVQINAANLDGATYSKLLTSSAFWERLSVSYKDSILLFQTDSGICGEGRDIDKFIQWDYCGAPWARNHGNDYVVGNGGFSIRNVATSKRLIKDFNKEENITDHEDMWFSGVCADADYCTICPIEVGREFATETIPDKSWGFHNSFEHHDKEQCDFERLIREINKKEDRTIGNVPGSDWKPSFNTRRAYKYFPYD